MGGVGDDYVKEVEKARRELRYLITNKQCAPLMRRLAWIDACTGCANGSIRLQTKTGLETAIQLCEDVKAKLKKVSYADLYQLAGIVAIEVTGGPTIHFLPGRQDSNEDPPELQSGKEVLDAQGLRNTFSRMGLSEDKDIVALCGGKMLLSNDISGQMAKDPLKFDNSYFVKLWSNVSQRLPMNPMDDALVKDENFRHYVELYAKDEDTFFKDYAIAHEKLSEVGCNLKKLNQPKPPKGLFEKLSQPRELIGIGLVSVVVTVILGYLIKKKKRNHLENEEDLDTIY